MRGIQQPGSAAEAQSADVTGAVTSGGNNGDSDCILAAKAPDVLTVKKLPFS